MKTKLTPPAKEIRLTIPVSAEVHATFTRIGQAGNVPVGRAMGEWLADTVDAAKHMAHLMEQARSAPAIVARELHSYALGITDITADLMAQLRAKGAADRASGALDESAAPAGTSPYSNTGGKVSGERTPKGSKGGTKK